MKLNRKQLKFVNKSNHPRCNVTMLGIEAGHPVSPIVKHKATRADGLGFNYRAGQIGPSVTNIEIS